MAEVEKVFVLKTSELEQFRTVQQVIALKTIYKVAARNPSASWDELIDMSRNDLAASHERIRRGEKSIDENLEAQELTPEEIDELNNNTEEEALVEEEVIFEELPQLPTLVEPEPEPEIELEPYEEPEEIDLPKDPDVADYQDEEEEETLAAIRQFSNKGGVIGDAADWDS